MKINLTDPSLNHIVRRAGYSFWYLFFGPLYLMFRLRWEGLALAAAYFYLLPIPGMEQLIAWLGTLSFISPSFLNPASQVLLYFRAGFLSFQTYAGLAAVAVFHIAFSFACDNWLLRKKMRKKHWLPVSELDARYLLFCRVIRPKELMDRKRGKDDFAEQAERAWEDKNLSYTTMLSRQEIADRGKTGGLDAGSDREAERILHQKNTELLRRGTISSEEYEIMEKNRPGKEDRR